jgi:hypothetical protein
MLRTSRARHLRRDLRQQCRCGHPYNLALIGSIQVASNSQDNDHGLMKRTLTDGSHHCRWLSLVTSMVLLLCRVETADSAPANDAFSGRIQIGPGNVHTNGTMRGASIESGEPWQNLFAKSVWWVWTTTNTGTVTLVVDASHDDGGGTASLSINVSTGSSLVHWGRILTPAPFRPAARVHPSGRCRGLP